MLCDVLSSQKLVAKTENGIASITFILEQYIKKTIGKVFKDSLTCQGIDVWKDTKRVAQWMYRNAKKRIDETSLLSVIKTGENFLSSMIQMGFMGAYESDDEKYYHSLGFANTYAFMVTKETAKKYHLKKVSDLEKYKDELRLGMDTQWMNRAGDGYPAFVKDYGFKFDSARPMQIGLVYDALKNNKLDVAVGYSTDGRIAAYDLKILEDDRKFFPPYDGSPLANEQLIKNNPEIDKALKKLEGKISTEEMQKLNYEADGKGKEPAVIAEEYLKKHHYFEEKKGGHK